MLRNYLTIAYKVLLRRKFFAFVSLFGISFTLLVLMVAAAVVDHSLAPYPPETRQDRTLTVYSGMMTGGDNTWTGDAGYGLFDKYARNLPGVERLAIVSTPQDVFSYLNGNRLRSTLKRTDADFWRILEFDFLEGGPFGDDDVAEARLVAVINATTRGRFFGTGTALGQTIEADGQRFRVVGVVKDVPILRQTPFADLWVPVTTAKSDSYRTQLMGGFLAILLAKSADDFPEIKSEFAARMKQVEFPDPKTWNHIEAFPETPAENLASFGPGDSHEPKSAARLWAALAALALLFMLLPTVNLVNLNVSRIMERASEIGVRKAFGASSRTLVGQFVVENVALTLLGGAIGFALSLVALRVLSQSGLVQYAQFHVNLRVFLYGLGFALFFGVLSGVYPAWRMSRLHPVEALRGGSR